MDPVSPLRSPSLRPYGEAGPITGQAAGVPFVAVPPAGPRASAPLVVAWHLLDAPRTETAFAAALPLAGLDAWRVYLGLPLTGSRLPEGGFAELVQRGAADAVLNLYEPIVAGAVEEFPGALSELRERLRLDPGGVGVLGGSIGAAVAQVLVAEGPVDVRAAVLVSPLVRLRPAVEAMARGYGVAYPWTPASEAVADRLDFVARAGDIAARGGPGVLLVVGADDDAVIRDSAEALHAALRGAADVELATVPGMGHALADEPGTQPAEQTPHAVAVDRLAVAWFKSHLAG